MKTVVLAGCGNIGFRHLQALSGMTVPAHILIVEPNAAAHGRIRDHVAASAQGPHRFTLAPGLDDAPLPPEVDLAVVATDTRHRRAAWDGLSSATSVKAVIFEKVLFPTLGDIEEVGRDLEARGTLGFVNCGRRGFPDYQALRRRFGGSGLPVDIAVEGANYGLGSNAVHFLDLAELLNQAELVEVSAAGLEPGGRPSKRQDYVEIFGTLRGRLSNGASVTVDCSDTGPLSVRVGLAGADGSRLLIDEVAATCTEAGTTAAFSVRQVSGMVELYQDILTEGRSALPGYAASARQHRLFITALRDHLGLSNAADDPCPVS